MGKTIRNYKGIDYPDKSKKKERDRKRFVYRDEGWSTKSQGGGGNKRAWKNGLPNWKYKQLKEQQDEKEFS